MAKHAHLGYFKTLLRCISSVTSMNKAHHHEKFLLKRLRQGAKHPLSKRTQQAGTRIHSRCLGRSRRRPIQAEG